MIRLAGTLEGFGRLGQGMKEAYGEGREDNRVAFKRSREDQGYEPEDVRLGMSLGKTELGKCSKVWCLDSVIKPWKRFMKIWAWVFHPTRGHVLDRF